MGSSFLRMGTIAVGVNGWMEEKGKKSLFQTKKKHFHEFSEFSEMDKHNDTK